MESSKDSFLFILAILGAVGSVISILGYYGIKHTQLHHSIKRFFAIFWEILLYLILQPLTGFLIKVVLYLGVLFVFFWLIGVVLK